MVFRIPKSRKARVSIIAAVVAIHIFIAYAFISGLAVDIVRSVGDSLNVITLSEDPVPPPTEPISEPARVEQKDEADEGAASPENKKAKATQIVTPKPKIALPPKNPVVTAPIEGRGSQNDAGASDRDGPGFGSGGIGNGTGSGRGGDGTGGGGAVTKPRKTAGAISNSDYPKAARKAKIGGTVRVQYSVGADGRVSNCRLRQSSGNADLDTATCRLIEARFRYEPARDARGNPVPSEAGWQQDWWLETRGGRRVTD